MNHEDLERIPVSVKTTAGRWIQIYAAEGDTYILFDPLDEIELGRILYDHKGHWVYDGDQLSVDEQEEVNKTILNNQGEMDTFGKLMRGR